MSAFFKPSALPPDEPSLFRDRRQVLAHRLIFRGQRCQNHRSLHLVPQLLQKHVRASTSRPYAKNLKILECISINVDQE
jgi:hypothetical protein